ncbi:peptidase M24, structural domain-containing protein [Mycotypha africana]|uniref:peptidase M24, structural domain-containing protein n=1 Tax=Mycotypha africana TaxID=64632 RepID=UPI002300414A|nr:peptidase M24, structural domain-containing protein [Mycotypha africana]KAI8971535.1 peptidase M24, structural domain-containing protein [Mycotypha africana]
MPPHPVNISQQQKQQYCNIYQDQFIPTKQHCLRVKQLLRALHPDHEHDSTSLIYMKGKTGETRDSTDVDLEFRQESNFFYLTGVDEPDFQLIFHLQNERVYLVAPTVPENEVLWKGPNFQPADLLVQYDVDEIIPEQNFSQLIYTLDPKRIYVLDEQQQIALSQSISTLPGSALMKIDTQSLLPALHESRLIKFPWEIELLRHAMHGSSQAHIMLIQQFQPGMTEAHLTALFRWSCACLGIFRQAYLPIVASGARNAILHYNSAKNQRQRVPVHDLHALVLVDAGGERACYSSDITRTFPAQGRFSEEAKTIYNIVLKMQKTILSRLRPGVFWADMEDLAIQILCKELVRIGILVGDNIDELIQRGLPTAFFYHGLGHSVGLDVHDVGGRKPYITTNTVNKAATVVNNCNHIEPNKKEEDELSAFLEDRPLEKNMVLTVEPGLYFNDTLLDIWTQFPGYQSYFNLNALAKYRKVGGVRIEDTIVITDSGYENLTSVPKEIDEIESLMKQNDSILAVDS